MTLNDLLIDCEFWTGLGITSNEKLKALFVNLLNREYERALALLGTSSRLSGFDDTNYSSQPFSFFDIVQGQNDYEFLADGDGNSITDITAVLILPSASATEFVKLDRLTLDDPNAELVMSPNALSVGVPTSFLERNNTVFFNLKPNYAKDKGGKLFYKRVPSYFTADDLTKSPGFNADHHQLLSVSASYNWLLVNKSNAKTLISRIEAKLLKMEREFKVYCELRNPQIRRIEVRRESAR